MISLCCDNRVIDAVKEYSSLFKYKIHFKKSYIICYYTYVILLFTFNTYATESYSAWVRMEMTKHPKEKKIAKKFVPFVAGVGCGITISVIFCLAIAMVVGELGKCFYT